MLSRLDLHDYQRRGVEFIKAEKRCALFLFMGAGKTTTTLTAVSDLLDGFEVSKVLVIAPLRVANSVWAQECQNWEHLQHLKVNVCTGSEKNRLAKLQTAADIYTINRENVPWLVEHYKNKWPFDCVVIDESSSFKNSSSKGFKKLKQVMPLTTHCVLLTGTPSPNSLLELWPQLYLVDFGERLGRTMSGFKRRFFESDYMGYKWELKKGCADVIHALIDDKCLSMIAEDYLKLPERIDLKEVIDLPAKALKAYQQFEKELFIQIEGEEIEAINAAVLANKLLQFSAGANYIDENKNWIETHKAKLDALADIVEANEGENILVAYNYNSDLERLKKRFPDAVVLDKEQSTIDAWNAGQIPMLLAHPAACGHGVNLQHGGSIIVWFSLIWSLELYQQFNARLHRQGQSVSVRIIHLIANGTVDERVLSVLADKDATQSALIDALKGVL